MYDYLIVGSGLFGCVFAEQAKRDKKKCLIIEKRNHPFGNCYTENIHGINIHKYGPHIFHTNNEDIWEYVNKFAIFNNYVNRPKVNYGGNIYSFPINLMTLYQLWGVSTPDQARQKLDSVKVSISNPSNLEEWVLSQVGSEIYEKFIKGYTEKQWNTDPKNLPSSIIKRLPIRLNFNDNYFNDKYQGIPIGGYTQMMQNISDGTEIILNTDYIDNREYWNSIAKKIVYTGPIDRFFDYSFGVLDYRSLKFEQQVLDTDYFQGCAIVNYTDKQVPFTRIIEHKYFEESAFIKDKTVVTREYPQDWKVGMDAFYPINNKLNNDIFTKYKLLANDFNKNTIFGGRLAEYCYYDMHQIIGSAWSKYKK